MALLPDIDFRSVLNVVEENFERVGLKAYAIRMMYIGEHSFMLQKAYAIRMMYIGEHSLPKDEMIKHFQACINDVNSTYCEINVHGLLVVYDSYFVHIVEGSEDTIHRHFRFLFNREVKWIEQKNKEFDEAALGEETEDGLTVILEEQPAEKPDYKMFKRLKILIVYHSIQTLMFDDWQALVARPPSLITKLDVNGPLSEHMEQLKICLDKIRRIIVLAKTDENLSFEGLSAVDPRIEALPEVALLDYLLHSKHILDLRQVVHLHRRVDDYAFYFENVWPLPNHFTPKLLYKLKVDDSFVEPLPVMPWELVKKETGEDEEREERDSSSSSD